MAASRPAKRLAGMTDGMELLNQLEIGSSPDGGGKNGRMTRGRGLARKYINPVCVCTATRPHSLGSEFGGGRDASEAARLDEDERSGRRSARSSQSLRLISTAR